MNVYIYIGVIFLKIKDTFLIKTVAGRTIVVPVGSAALDFNAVVSLNETGAFLFTQLQKADMTESELADALCAEYDVTREIAEKDISAFIKKIEEAGMAE